MQANVIDKVKFFFFLNKAGIAFLSYKGELFRAQVPNLWAMDHFCQISDNIRLEIKCTINVMNLNHPKSTPSFHLVHGKIVFHKTSPCCQKDWGSLV